MVFPDHDYAVFSADGKLRNEKRNCLCSVVSIPLSISRGDWARPFFSEFTELKVGAHATSQTFHLGIPSDRTQVRSPIFHFPISTEH